MVTSSGRKEIAWKFDEYPNKKKLSVIFTLSPSGGRLKNCSRTAAERTIRFVALWWPFKELLD